MDSLVITISFGLFLLMFTLIGVMSARVRRSSSEDYLVASRNVNPWAVALSAVSTNNSGYMFIGLIGFAWRVGVQTVWLFVGWILGGCLTRLWVHRRLRTQSEEKNVASVPGLLAIGRDGKTLRPVAMVAGLITFFFLGGYAAAQLKAGSITLNAMFGWPMWVGSVVGVVIVTVYCMAGGIRASIWTDVAQSIVMIGAIVLLLAISHIEVGSFQGLFDGLRRADPSLVKLMPGGTMSSLGLYVLGFLFAGFATIGQPHVLIRFMAIDSTDSIRKARNIYIIWYILFATACIAVGLYARVLMPELGAGATGSELVRLTEGALPQLSLKLMHPILIGVVLAGLFAATMSTADSQLLSCSAAVTQDIYPKWSSSLGASKLATLAVAGLALVIALTATSGVFSIVMIAWSALGASIGPVLLIRLAGRPLSSALAIVMMLSGLATVVLWGMSPYADIVFKALPGMLVPLIIYGFVCLIRRKKRHPVIRRKK